MSRKDLNCCGSSCRCFQYNVGKEPIIIKVMICSELEKVDCYNRVKLHGKRLGQYNGKAMKPPHHLASMPYGWEAKTREQGLPFLSEGRDRLASTLTGKIYCRRDVHWVTLRVGLQR